MNVCAVIAAAGLSSRMGAFKPLLPFNGRPAIVRLLETMQSAGVNQTILVTGFRHDELEKACWGIPSLTLIQNTSFANTQMFDSARLGFSAVPTACDRILFTPADIPLVARSTVHWLARTSAPLVFPSYRRRRGHPISLHAALLPSVLRYNGPGGLKGALSSLPVQPAYLTVTDPFVRMEMDTPDDYDALLRRSLISGKENDHVADAQYVELSQLAAKPEYSTQLFYS